MNWQTSPSSTAEILGFLFEPDADTGLLKIVANGAGYVNLKSADSTVSLPTESNDGIPAADELLIRRLLNETFPHLAQRPLVKPFICWCADTADSDYIIDYVPNTGGKDRKAGLIVASGDSGHAFKMLPIAGKWVMKVLEEGEQRIERWKWKETATSGWDKDISWRVGDVQNIATLGRMTSNM